MTRDDCINYGINDYGFGEHERHDAFCFKHYVWCPNCDNCDDYERETEH